MNMETRPPSQAFTQIGQNKKEPLRRKEKQPMIVSVETQVDSLDKVLAQLPSSFLTGPLNKEIVQPFSNSVRNYVNPSKPLDRT